MDRAIRIFHQIDNTRDLYLKQSNPEVRKVLAEHLKDLVELLCDEDREDLARNILKSSDTLRV